MKTETEIRKEAQDLRDYYVRSMNCGCRFSPKDKYKTQGKIELLDWILEE